MSAIEETPTVSEPMEENHSMESSVETFSTNTGNELITKTKKTLQRKQKLKQMSIHARIKYREKVIKQFRNHLKQGTFPKRFKSLRPYPKMNSPEAQAIVNAACDQVQNVVLDQMILDEEKKLTQEQEEYQILKEQRLSERPQLNKPKKPKMMTVVQLRQELADLQSKYTQLCSKLDNRE